MSNSKQLDNEILDERKVEALEKISDNLSDIVMWLEEIDKDDWGKRIQFYLNEFFKIASKYDKGSQTGSDSSVQE
tara:strand:- start:4822 stop:5046 length:225 start_codon:yes stop_codon:yes gene_type:complete